MAKGHISFGKQLLRALFGILTALGFGSLWYALFAGIGENVWFFVAGIGAISLGILHLVLAVKKQIDFNRRFCR